MGFDQFFKDIYGERWTELRAALEREPEKVQLKNPFGGALSDYSLDKASLCPARRLDVKPGDVVADFCSAPGGKLLAMIFELGSQALSNRFLAMDLSPDRVARLKAVLYDCLPPEILGRIEVRKGDASRVGLHRKESFDKILLDAPCSAERHLLKSADGLARWSVKGMKRLAIRQHALLCSALDSVKPGGRVVYSTCSLSPLENDGVINRLFESREGQFQVVTQSLSPYPGAETTEYGEILLPDRGQGGPIYCAVIEKL